MAKSSAGNSVAAAVEPRHELRVALDGFSIETGARESASLNRSAHLLPDHTQVFLNMMPKDRIEDRIRICRQIRSFGMSPVPHIAARLVARKREVRKMLDTYLQEGRVAGFLVVAGDYNRPSGEIEDTLSLLRAIGPGQTGIRRIGVAGYPEGHPRIADDILDKALHEKIAVLQALDIEPFVVTQFSFDADAIIRWCEQFHARYPAIRIQVGVPGPAKLTALIRFAQRCGVRSSMKKLRGLPVSSSLKLLQRIPPVTQAVAVGRYRKEHRENTAMHFFTFGGMEASLEWVRGEIAGRPPGPG